MRSALVFLLLIMLIPVLATADVTIKEKTTMRGFMGMWTSQGTETTYLKGDKYRNESDVERSGIVPPSPIKDAPPRVTIIRLDKGLMYRVNLKDKTYQELSLEDMAKDDEAKRTFEITDLKVESTGETKEIAGRPCKGVTAQITFKVRSGDEVVDQALDMLFWMTEDTKGLEEMKTFWEQSLRLAQGQDQEIPIWEGLDKMWAESEEFKGIPLGIEITIASTLGEEELAEMEQTVKGMLKAQTGEEPSGADKDVKITREVVSISTGKIDDSLFEVPEGFRQAARIRIW
jgi:hypothetical protein